MFRPCIDLQAGLVKQIVGGQLSADGAVAPVNFVSDKPARHYAELYQAHHLTGGHVILLDQAAASLGEAREALNAWPGGMQVGGGVHPQNARNWLNAGASHVIVTSYVFHHGTLDQDRLDAMEQAVGRNHLVLDLSCRRRGDEYFVATDRWTRVTEVRIGPELLERLARQCAEFLVHAADVEGRREGIDRDLVEKLGAWSPIATTYAGGARSLADLEDVTRIGRGRIDLTIGSALDIFGGKEVRFEDVVAFNRRARNG